MIYTREHACLGSRMYEQISHSSAHFLIRYIVQVYRELRLFDGYMHQLRFCIHCRDFTQFNLLVVHLLLNPT
jgi:hypothetical protein